MFRIEIVFFNNMGGINIFVVIKYNYYRIVCLYVEVYEIFKLKLE